MDKRYTALGTSIVMLGLSEQQSMYGYQITKELGWQSQQVFCLQEGILYPVLYGLEQWGAVTGVQETAESGCTRKYHEIAEYGRKVLTEKTAEWQMYQDAVNRMIGGEVSD